MAEPPIPPGLTNATKDSPGVMYDEFGRPYVLVKRKVKRRKKGGDRQSSYEPSIYTDYPFMPDMELNQMPAHREVSAERKQSLEQQIPTMVRRASPQRQASSPPRRQSPGQYQPDSSGRPTVGQYNYEDMVTGQKTIRAQSIPGKLY